MRRALLWLVATASALLALAAPSSATQVIHAEFNGPFAAGVWSNITANSETDTVLFVSTGNSPELFIDQFTANFDINHHFTGGTETRVENVTSGFSFHMKQPLANADLTASGLPATTCTYDASFNQIGCTGTTIDANASWIGQGPINHTSVTDRFTSNGFTEIDHGNGSIRDATATGTVGGFTLTASDLDFALLEKENFAGVVICLGTSSC
jgi:hypothetical protein